MLPSRYYHRALFVALFLVALSAIPARASSLRFRLPADPSTLDWTYAHTSHDTYLMTNIMEGLVEEGADLVPKPALAERWEISPDGKIYTFHLRPGVKWSDGRPLKASHFRDAWIRLLDPKTHSGNASYLFDLENAEEFHGGKIKDPSAVGVKVLSDSKLQVKLKRVVPYFLHLPTFWPTFPVRLDLIKKKGKLVTLGPYRVTQWKKGKIIRLSKNPTYYGGETSAPDSVEILIESNDKKARELFSAGKLDFLLDATTEDLLKAKAKVEAKKVRIAQFPYLATYYLGFNVNAGPLRDQSIRRALALAVDRESIAAALQGGQVAAKSWLPPGIPGYRAEGASAPGSLYEARAALTKAGFSEGRGFPKMEFWMARYDGAEALADFLMKSLREKLGIEVEPHIVAPAEYNAAFKAGKAALFVGHWGADFPDPANFYEVFAGGNASNRTGWVNKEYDQYLATARATLDSAARIGAYEAAEKLLLAQEVVILPLFYKRNIALLGPKLKEFNISPLNYLFLKAVKVGEN